MVRFTNELIEIHGVPHLSHIKIIRDLLITQDIYEGEEENSPRYLFKEAGGLRIIGNMKYYSNRELGEIAGWLIYRYFPEAQTPEFIQAVNP